MRILTPGNQMNFFFITIGSKEDAIFNKQWITLGCNFRCYLYEEVEAILWGDFKMIDMIGWDAIDIDAINGGIATHQTYIRVYNAIIGIENF